MRGWVLPRSVVVWLMIAAVAGCGSSSSATENPPLRNATLILDFTPNAVHTGIYAALSRHFDRDEGVRLHVIAPTQSSDPIKLLETGKVDFAILDIHDLAIARERGADIIGIMAVVQRPLSAVVAAPGIGSPHSLEGKTVGITGVPSDTAVLRSVVVGAGGNPARVKTITIGFNAVADLLAGRVAAATAFWNDEGQAIRSKRPGFHIFRVDDYGAPSYPELVVCVTRSTLQHRAGLARTTVVALERGYAFTLQHPAQGADDLEHQVRGLDPTLVQAQLTGLLSAFKAADGRVGELNLATLRKWAAWEARFGIVTHPPQVSRAFDPSLTAGSARP